MEFLCYRGPAVIAAPAVIAGADCHRGIGSRREPRCRSPRGDR
jgi:hypothetical protein